VSAGDLLVLDASVGVKWFRAESGSEDALALLDLAERDIAGLAAPTHFVHEVLSAVARRHDTSGVISAWEFIVDSRLEIVPLTDAVVREATVQCERLGCCFYDSLAPAVASLLGATLVSADSRAHGAYPGVRLIG
jgi:predicted nucleic acid-binding protein